MHTRKQLGLLGLLLLLMGALMTLAGGAEAASMTSAPAVVPAGHIGIVSLSLAGNATTFGSDTFTITNSVTGTTAASATYANVSATSETVSLTVGASAGSFVISTTGTDTVSVTIIVSQPTFGPGGVSGQAFRVLPSSTTAVKIVARNALYNYDFPTFTASAGTISGIGYTGATLASFTYVAPATPQIVTITDPTTGLTFTIMVAAAGTTYWSPLTEQRREADTLYLLEGGKEQAKAPQWQTQAYDGFAFYPYSFANAPPFQDVVAAPGKYADRLGFLDLDYSDTQSTCWTPIEGLLPTDQFTIEFNIRCSQSWAAIGSKNIVTLGDNPNSANVITFIVRPTLIIVQVTNPTTAVQGNPIQVYNTITTPTAGQVVNIALTFSQSAGLKLYVDGVLGSGSGTSLVTSAAQSYTAGLASVFPFNAFASGNVYDGLQIFGTGGNFGGWSVSDLRLSRTARAINAVTTYASVSPTLTVTSTATGNSIVSGLAGKLFGYASPSSASATAGKKVFTATRFDHILDRMPIVAGSPDGTHPSAGHSGSYSYDWRGVDASMAQYVTAEGTVPYISLDYTPQALGGNNAPDTTGVILVNAGTNYSTPAPAAGNYSAYATICADIAYHLIHDGGYTVPYFGLWNEPDTTGSAFLVAGYNQEFLAVYTALRALGIGAKLAGPELSTSKGAGYTFLSSFLTYCAANSCVPDAVSYHFYEGNIDQIARARADLTNLCAATSPAISPVPPMIVGEASYSLVTKPNAAGLWPYQSTNLFRNDWGGAFEATSLMECQAAGVLYLIHSFPELGGIVDSGNGGNMGMLSSGTGDAQFNVLTAWKKMSGNAVLSSTLSGIPGLSAVACTGASGHTYVLLSYLKYRKDEPLGLGDSTATLAITLPISTAGLAVTDTVIDDQHNDPLDQGAAFIGGEAGAGQVVSAGGTLSVRLRPRSVHFLDIGPLAGGTKRRLQ